MRAALLGGLVLALACGTTAPTPMRFLALGDSFTIGESVPADQRWPNQLARALRAKQIDIGDPQIIAKTGWTTDELSAAIDQTGPHGPFDLVTLLIGVNNQYRGRSADQYREQFTALLRRAIDFAGGNPRRVIVVSIPDWGMTPFAAGRDRARIATEIDQFNAINRQEARRVGIGWVDVTTISRQNPTLVAADGLHPSAAMYTEWVKVILVAAVDALK